MYRVPQFQSTPEPRPGRDMQYQDGQSHHQCFNPRPSLDPGETGLTNENANRSLGFNPRPSLDPGETLSKLSI